LTAGSISTGFGNINIGSNTFTGTGSGLTGLNGSSISSGTVADARLTPDVTLQGNTFNSNSQLVQLTAGGLLPVLNGSNLTNLNGSSIASGTVANTYLTNGGALTVTAGTGLSGGGSVALGGSSTALSVAYGFTGSTAVQGNTTLVCPSGSGNLTGTGNTITLGSGGTCNNLGISATPAFTTATLTGANALTLGTASSHTGAIVFQGQGGAGTLTFQGPTTPNTGNFTLSIPTITASANICTDNSVCSGYAASSGSGNYIQNQNSSAQTSANFSISGSGAASTSFIAPSYTGTGAISVASGGTNTNLTLQAAGTATASLDTTGAGTVTVGNTNATTIQVGNTTTAVTQTIGIGNNTTAGSSTALTVGSLIGASPTIIQGGTTGVAVTAAAGTTGTAGGSGGGITLTTGNGGNGSTTNGNGGNLTLSAGTAGSGAGTAGTAGSVIVKNQGNSATAFQVQNTSGAAALSVNTAAFTTTLQAGTTGSNGNDTTTLGSNLATVTDFCNADWTTTNWTLSPLCSSPPATTATHVVSGGNVSALSTNQVTPVSGTTYEITYTITGNPTTGTTLNVTFGGQTVGGSSPSYTMNGINFTDSRIVTATSNSGFLTFTPSASFNGTISAVTIQQVNQTPTAVLVVNNAAGSPNIQVTASSSPTNEFIGLSSGSVNNSGSIQNTALGTQALQNNTTGSENAALGYQALQLNSTGINNVAIGDVALQNNTVGVDNTAVGALALQKNTTGANNAALGTDALVQNTYGNDDTAIGALTLISNTTGAQNTALGTFALEDDSTGAQNTALGENALPDVTTSSGSTAAGYFALHLSTGANNTAFGDSAGYTATSGDANTSGANNTFLGYQAGQGQGLYQTSFSTALGQDSAVNQSNAIILGCTTTAANANGCATTTNVGIGIQYAPNALTVSSSVYGVNGTAGTTTAITQSGTTVTGSTSPATAWTTGMVGGTLYYNDGSTATITSINTGASPQTMVVSASKTIGTAANYTIVYGGFNVTTTANGADAYLQPSADSTSVFKVQNAANTTTLLDVDSLNSRVGIGTATPAYALDVVGDINASSTLKVGGVTVCTSAGCTGATTSGSFINNATGPAQAADFNIQATAVGQIAAQIGGYSGGGQTADLLDLENSSGTVLSGFTAAGVLHGGNGSGTNNAVAPQNLVLAGGQGTGTGAGGNITFQVAKAGTTGSTLNSLATVATISGTNGAATFENSTNSTTAFWVQNATGGTGTVFDVNTTNSEVGINTASPSQTLTLANGSENFRLQSPGISSLTPSASGGSLATNTYYYKVTSLDGAGNETAISSSAESSTAVTGPSGSVVINWPVIAGALGGYRVYRGTSAGGESVYFSVAYGTNTFTDTGAAGTAGTGSTNPTASSVFINGNGNTYFDTGNVGINNAAPGNLLSIGALTTADSAAQLAVSTGGAAKKALVLQAVSSQTADILDVENSATGAVLFGISATGHIITGGTGTTATPVSAGLGSTGTCVLNPTNFAVGNDTAGTIVLTPNGAGISSSTQCTVNLTAYGSYPHVVISPADANSAARGAYAAATSTSTFTIGFTTAGSSGVPYTFNYFVVQ